LPSVRATSTTKEAALNRWLSIAISAVSDFIITAGTGYLTVATASGATLPTTAQVVVCVVGGVVQAFRGVQKTLTPAPP
jgi:hypothetical protein